MSADALAPCDARSPAAVILTKQDELFLTFRKAGFHITTPSHY